MDVELCLNVRAKICVGLNNLTVGTYKSGRFDWFQLAQFNKHKHVHVCQHFFN